METKYLLREWRMEDLNSLVKYANNPHIADYLTDRYPHPYGMKDGIKFIKMASSQNPGRIFAIEIEGHAAGAIGLEPREDIHRLNAELGYWLAEPFWGRGIMTAVIKEMVDYGFKTFEINRIYARPFGSNQASHRVLEKAGFRLEARLEQVLVKNGRFEDELIYAIRK